jgi:hypothetical protein
VQLNEYFTGDVSKSWERCFPVWREEGRVVGIPHGERRPRYIPTFGNRLAREFVSRFRDSWGFLVSKLQSEDPLARVCAFDLLEHVAADFDCNSEELPEGLCKIDVEIPEPALSDIRSEYRFKAFDGTTVGAFLQFLIQNG